MDAEAEIKARNERMGRANTDRPELIQIAWLRELTAEVTRLRADLARLADRTDHRPE